MDECIYRFRLEDVNSFFFFLKKIYVNVYDKYILSINEMCEARDYLIILISFKISIRLGVLENLKMEEYFQVSIDLVIGWVLQICCEKI